MKKCDMNQLSALSIGVLLSVILIIAVYKNKGKIGKIRITAKQWKKWCIGGIIIFSAILAIRLSDPHLAKNIIEGNESGGLGNIEDNAPFEIEHEDDLINEFPELFSQDKAGSCSSENLAGNNIDKFKKCQVDLYASIGEIWEDKGGLEHTASLLGINMPIIFTEVYKAMGMKLGNEKEEVKGPEVIEKNGKKYQEIENNDEFLGPDFNVKVDDFNAGVMDIYNEKAKQIYNFDTLYKGVNTEGLKRDTKPYYTLTHACNKVIVQTKKDKKDPDKKDQKQDFSKCHQLKEFGEFMTSKNIKVDTEYWGKTMKSQMQLKEGDEIPYYKDTIKNPSNISKLKHFFYTLDEKINQLTEKSKKAS
tara:strand:+ start:111 stop:1193 length:1083 start_codon:yes stop_codon:yes gene_type:complete